MHFSQKLQHIGDKYMFLIGNIPRNFIIAQKFHVSGYWFTAQNMENIDFRTSFTVTAQQWSLPN